MEDSAQRARRPAVRTEHSGHSGPADEARSPRARREDARTARPELVHTLAEFVVQQDLRHARTLLDARRERGDSVETLCLDYLAPAARLLGDLWNDDRLTFTEVTIGVGRLQDLHFQLSEHLALPRSLSVQAPRALVAPVPGEQHSFGAAMAASLLHGRGWEITGAPRSREGDLIAAAGMGWFEMIGLSVACERFVAPTEALVARLRDASMNPGVRIVIGGAIVEQAPGLARELGADDSVLDVRVLAEDELRAAAEAASEG